MAHFGATLRWLRLEAGLGLRELAAHVGVSSAYLSRVENGHDPIPTAERLATLADVLGVSRAIIFDLARQTGPAVSGYIQRVPAAGILLAEIAQRDLCLTDIARVRAFIEREFPLSRPSSAERPALSRLIEPSGVILGVTCPSLAELISLAVARLTLPASLAAPALVRTLLANHELAPPWIGSGVLALHLALAEIAPQLVVLSLRQPLALATPDSQPIRLVFLVITHPDDTKSVTTLASLARLVSYPDVLARLEAASTPKQVLDAIRDAESVW